MHELSVIKEIILMVLTVAEDNNAKKVISVNIEIGALSDFQEF